MKSTAESMAEVEFTLHTDSGQHTPAGAIDPMAQGVFGDIVGTVDIKDKGTLEICSTHQLKVSSRIYNSSESGTFGQFVGGYSTEYESTTV